MSARIFHLFSEMPRERSVEQAQALLPLLNRITRTAHDKVERLMVQLDSTNDPDTVSRLELETNRLIQAWQDRLTALNVSPKGLWIADIDSGEDLYCWKFPETRLEFRHSYAHGFSKRVKFT